MKLPDWLKLLKGTMDDTGDEPVDLMLYEPNGEIDRMTSAVFGDAMSMIPKRKTVNLLLNTLGGRIDHGTAIYNMIRARGNVNTVVIGFAASMGSIIAQAGATRKMMPGSCIVIHNPQGGFNGESADGEAALSALRVMKNNLVGIYHEHTGLAKKKISDLMDATTTMSPDEAQELGFCDEVVTDSPAWNSLTVTPSRKDIFNIFRQLSGSVVRPAAESKPTEINKTMKTLIAALAKAKLVPTPDLTDEAAVVTHFETNFGLLGLDAMRTENTNLKSRVTAFEAAQKTRVTAKIEKAITDKLVKSERKDDLIAQGVENETRLDNYLADLEGIKASTSTPRHGAKPLPREGGNENADGVQAQLDSLRAELREPETTPARASEIAKQLRDLRGHKNLFAAPAAK